ncbi:MAG TPA: hypothetical protein VHO69_01580, partial [Phototrophicaceae bacterium]|nr:hypothetical protein [Phototrophicaceae bacterium]
AGEGDVICYTPGDQMLPSIEDYDHWPVRADLFRQNYRPWTEAGWRPNPVEIFLMTQGCRPFYKTVGIWAQRLRRALF